MNERLLFGSLLLSLLLEDVLHEDALVLERVPLAPQVELVVAREYSESDQGQPSQRDLEIIGKSVKRILI